MMANIWYFNIAMANDQCLGELRIEMLMFHSYCMLNYQNGHLNRKTIYGHGGSSMAILRTLPSLVEISWQFDHSEWDFGADGQQVSVVFYPKSAKCSSNLYLWERPLFLGLEVINGHWLHLPPVLLSIRRT